MIILSNLDLTKNQLLNAALQNLSTAPATPVGGQVYYNTSDKRAYLFNGSTWVGMDAIGATMTASDIVTSINGSTSIINLDNLPQTVRNAVTASHTSHTIDSVAGLQTALDAKETPSSAQAKATTAQTNANNYTDSKIAEIIGAAPDTLDSLNELAAAIGNDPNFATTLATMMASKTEKFATSVGTGSSTSIIVTHNLNSMDVVVSVREVASPYAVVLCDVEHTNVNSITLRFATAPTSNQYRVTVVG